MDVSQNILALLVLGYLRKNCQGRAAARTTAWIAADLTALGLDRVDSRAVRDALADLVLGGWPVGTATGRPSGAFLCADREDFRAGYRNLTRRFRSQAARARKFAATASAVLGGQRRFDFAEADNAFHELAAAPLLAGTRGGT